jgi:hypothetical protein
MGAHLSKRYSVKISYKVQPDRYGDHLYTVVLKTQVSLPFVNSPRTRQLEVIVDSGASRCMFHADIGRYLGLDIQKGDLENTQGIQGATKSWIHPIRLHIFGAPIDVHAGFMDGIPCAGLLGMNGFFDHFLVSFIHPALACEIHRIDLDQA